MMIQREDDQVCGRYLLFSTQVVCMLVAGVAARLSRWSETRVQLDCLGFAFVLKSFISLLP